jgi:hypothetical protein
MGSREQRYGAAVRSEYFGSGWSGREHSPDQVGAYWPAGSRACAQEDLQWMLLGSARDNALRALSLYVSDNRLELLQAAVAIGAAVEQAAKACVASLEPALLAEKGQVDSVLWLTGHKTLAKTPSTEVRTITGLDAAQIARERKPGVVAPREEVQRAMNVRNSATHMAFVDQVELRAGVPAMVRIVDSIVRAMEEDREKFWVDRLNAVDELITQRLAEVSQVVSAKMAVARELIDRLTRGLGSDTKALVLAARARKRVFSDHEEPRPCPVCGQEGWLICGTYEEDLGIDPDGRSWFRKWAEPISFDCSVCELTLDGFEELDVLSLGDAFELDVVEDD